MKINLASKRVECSVVSLLLLLHLVFSFSSAWNLSTPADFSQNINAGYRYFAEGLVNPTSTTSQGHLFGIAPILAGVDPSSKEWAMGMLRSGNNKGILAFHGVLDRNEMNEEHYADVEGVKSDHLLKRVLRIGFFIESLLSVITALIIYIWGRMAFGRISGMIALVLYSFSPFMTTMVHSLHSDNSARLFVTLTFFLLWYFIMSPNWKRLFYLGISLGVTLCVKVSTAYYPFLILFIFLGVASINSNFSSKLSHAFSSKYNKYVTLFFLFVVLSLAALVMVNSLNLFKGVFTPLADYTEEPLKIESKIFSSLQTSFLGNIPLPISPYYILSVDYGKAWSEGGTGTFLFYFGDVFTGESPKSFYFVSFLTKTTLPVLLLFLFLHVIIVLLFLSSKGEKTKQKQFSLLFILFVGYFIFLFTAITTTHVSGLRHLSMVYPFIFIGISSLFSLKFPFKKIMKYGFFFLIVWHVFAYIFAYPFFIPYFNELVGKHNGYLYFRDSNVDYHEAYYHAIEYKKKNPDVVLFPPCLVQKGMVSMSPNDLNFQRAGCYGWLKGFEPVDFIGGNWPVYQVDGQWVQDENGQVRFMHSPTMKLRKKGFNPFLKWIAGV